MGVFAGHDHDNDYLGINKGIVLGYGRVTGADAYGELTRGARIIELYEGKFRFDTWITTPSGREATLLLSFRLEFRGRTDRGLPAGSKECIFTQTRGGIYLL